MKSDLTKIPGIGANMAEHLIWAGYPTIKSLGAQGGGSIVQNRVKKIRQKGKNKNQ